MLINLFYLFHIDMLATEIKVSEEEMKFLFCIIELYKEKTLDITEDGIMVLVATIMEKTGLSYYQQMTIRKKLVMKGLVFQKFREIPRKIYIKLNKELVKEFLELQGFKDVI